MSFLSSPRRRRRLIWGGGAALVVAGVAGTMVYLGNTGTDYDIAADAREPVRTEPELAPPTPFTPETQREVLQVAARFLRTAVVREDVEDSWELTAPSLKAGYTRETWATKDIPVTPYPVDSARWDLDYSWRGVVGLKVALFPKRGADVPAAIFDMQLHSVGRGDRRRWLVDSWTPTSYTGVPQGPLLGGSRNAIPAAVKSPLGPSWLLVPLSVLSLAVLVPLFVLGRGWWRDRRATRRYQATLR